jgi:hypothetical protein
MQRNRADSVGQVKPELNFGVLEVAAAVLLVEMAPAIAAGVAAAVCCRWTHPLW